MAAEEYHLPQDVAQDVALANDVAPSAVVAVSQVKGTCFSINCLQAHFCPRGLLLSACFAPARVPVMGPAQHKSKGDKATPVRTIVSSLKFSLSNSSS